MSRSVNKISVLLVISCIFATSLGCNTDGGKPPNVNPSAPPVTSGKTLIFCQRSGGFVGFNDTLMINDDGSCELTTRAIKRSFSLAPDDILKLKNLFDQADFFNLKSTQSPAGADYIEYKITYLNDSKKNMITVYSQAAPAALQPVIAALDRYIADNSN